ncbi:hypothetical protein I79_001430 [Cricetulus griseus]|uniref:Uncharacterized protein n=1 Tax=Cricetulus griseus TaxID=10029 RepID=G3GUQ9_CRIGR|nr:hypothetical protein I79_001430 [Cricetulus griseus]
MAFKLLSLKFIMSDRLPDPDSDPKSPKKITRHPSSCSWTVSVMLRCDTCRLPEPGQDCGQSCWTLEN